MRRLVMTYPASAVTGSYRLADQVGLWSRYLFRSSREYLLNIDGGLLFPILGIGLPVG
jgi:hypothetical protein